MNNETKYALKRLLVLYYSFRYSTYYPLFVPAVSLVVSILIIWFFFIPQVQSWFSVRDEVKATQSRILTIQNNIKYMQFSNGQTIDDNFAIVMKAMPGEKDFPGILTVLSDASSLANVTLEDYTFIVDTKAVADTTTPGVPVQLQSKTKTLMSVEVSFVLKGSVVAVHHLLRVIEKKLPLAEIKTVDYSDNKAQVELLFYAKALPSITIDDAIGIEGITSQEKELLQKLREWGS